MTLSCARRSDWATLLLWRVGRVAVVGPLQERRNSSVVNLRGTSKTHRKSGRNFEFEFRFRVLCAPAVFYYYYYYYYLLLLLIF